MYFETQLSRFPGRILRDSGAHRVQSLPSPGAAGPISSASQGQEDAAVSVLGQNLPSPGSPVLPSSGEGRHT